MCLSRPSPRFKLQKFYYKVFDKTIRGTLHTPMQSCGRVYRFNTWYNSSNVMLDYGKHDLNNKMYKSGFHCFPKLADAKNYLEDCGSNSIICKVKLKRFVAWGKQKVLFEDARCVVAQKIFIVKEMEI